MSFVTRYQCYGALNFKPEIEIWKAHKFTNETAAI